MEGVSCEQYFLNDQNTLLSVLEFRDDFEWNGCNKKHVLIGCKLKLQWICRHYNWSLQSCYMKQRCMISYGTPQYETWKNSSGMDHSVPSTLVSVYLVNFVHTKLYIWKNSSLGWRCYLDFKSRLLQCYPDESAFPNRLWNIIPQIIPVLFFFCYKISLSLTCHCGTAT